MSPPSGCWSSSLAAVKAIEGICSRPYGSTMESKRG